MTRNDAMMMVEARREERVRSFLRARIIYNNQNSTIDCTIKNITRHGAKLELGDAMSVPDSFDLEIPQKGRTYRSRLAWRSETAAGVEFLDADAPAQDDAKVSADRLERENKKLRATVAQLTKRLEDLGQAIDLT